MPKIDLGYDDNIIELCRSDAPNNSCRDCATTNLECVECQKEAAERQYGG